jgi:DNA invertase Pin-like site-specific DNA recombinase
LDESKAQGFMGEALPRPSSKQLQLAAQYLRMSTEHQQYSIANQSAAIALYAAAHNLGIVRSFADRGKTGRTLKGRLGLQELLSLVQAGQSEFTQVLVYDVSRWGRFLDADESAHYEYLCKRAGITVHYCAEQFENDNSPTSNLLKALKRTMASEYSRELSVKVSAGQRRLAAMGWWQGGNGPFGFQRLLVGADGSPKHILKFREWKSIDSDRISLTPGPKEAVDTIRLAYDLYTKGRKDRRKIAEILNKRGIFAGKRQWTLATVRELLINPVYKGAYAYCKHDHHFITLPRDKWLVREHAFEAIVSPKQWDHAYAMVREEVRDYTNVEMIEGLRKVWKREGKLNSTLINAASDVPSVQAYKNHFGGINEAYRLIGYPIVRDLSYINAVRFSIGLRNTICNDICERVSKLGGTAQKTLIPGLLQINGNVMVKVSVRKGWFRDGRILWQLLLGLRADYDVLVIGRLRAPERSVFDYFIVPAYSEIRGGLWTRLRHSVPYLELYHHQTLDPLIEAFGRCSIQEAA